MSGLSKSYAEKLGSNQGTAAAAANIQPRSAVTLDFGQQFATVRTLMMMAMGQLWPSCHRHLPRQFQDGVTTRRPSVMASAATAAARVAPSDRRGRRRAVGKTHSVGPFIGNDIQKMVGKIAR